MADYHWIDLPVFGRYGLPLHERGVGRDAGYIAARIADRGAGVSQQSAAVTGPGTPG